MLICSYAYLSYLANEKLPEILGDRVEIENIDISILGNTVLFNKPRFNLDSSNNANVHIVSCAKRITIGGFSFWDLILSSNLGVQKLTIDSTAIYVELPESQPTPTSQKEISLFVTEIFTSITVEELELVDAKILVTKQGTIDTLLLVEGFHLEAEQIVVDTATMHNIFPLEFKHSLVKINQYRMRAGELYTFSGQNLLIEDTTVNVENLHFESVHSKDEFARHQVEKARIDLVVESFNSKKILWDLDTSGLTIHASRLNLEKARLKVYKDKRPARQPKEVRPLLTGLMREIPFTLTVDTLTVRNSYVEYEQFPVLFPQSGKVFFDQMYVSAYNITNETSQISQHPKTTIDVQTDFMGEGKLLTNIQLDLRSPKQAFSVAGTLGKLPVTYVNQVMTPLVGVTAEGTVDKLTFAINGNDYDATGKLVCEYSDLKISMYDDGRDKEHLKSLLGNLLLRNNNQPDDVLGFKEGEIYFIRYQNKGFFNFLWNSVREGLMDTAVPFYNNPDKSRQDKTHKMKKDEPLLADWK